MNLNEKFGVTEKKVTELKARIKKLNIDVSKIDERFVRGGGKGGQKVNKTANCVVLKYPPLDLSVRCQKDRKRTVNRFIALRELVDKIEMETSPETSNRLKDIEKVKKRKAARRRKSKKKHGNSS